MQELEERKYSMGNNIQEIRNYLGDEADYLLGFNNPKVDSKLLHVPGPDYSVVLHNHLRLHRRGNARRLAAVLERHGVLLPGGGRGHDNQSHIRGAAGHLHHQGPEQGGLQHTGRVGQRAAHRADFRPRDITGHVLGRSVADPLQRHDIQPTTQQSPAQRG